MGPGEHLPKTRAVLLFRSIPLKEGSAKQQGWECKVTDARRAENSLLSGNLESGL